MAPKVNVGLYLMGIKGLAVLNALIEKAGSAHIAFVVTTNDDAVADDAYSDILTSARAAGITVYSRMERPQQTPSCIFAVAWRWLIRDLPQQKIVVFHDSLLPRYRGFAPLVNALINGERAIGVTALLAAEDYDRGPIIAQKSASVDYPITISQAITTILPCYTTLAIQVYNELIAGTLKGTPQDETKASYSLWRDEEDYFIDWTLDANTIRRFVDAVGFPYKGAAAAIDGKVYRLRECESHPDVAIENRDVGKVIFLKEGKPVVVCGKGLLKINFLTQDGSDDNLLPLRKFRIRFSALPSSIRTQQYREG